MYGSVLQTKKNSLLLLEKIHVFNINLIFNINILFKLKLKTLMFKNPF